MTAVVALGPEPAAESEARSGSAAVVTVEPSLSSRPRGTRVLAESGCACAEGRRGNRVAREARGVPRSNAASPRGANVARLGPLTFKT
jgi:hypothetical protein